MWDGIMFFGILAVAMAADSIGPARCGIGIAALLLLRMSGPALAWLSATRKKERPRCCRSNKRSLMLKQFDYSICHPKRQGGGAP